MRSGLRTLWIAVSVLTATPAFSQPYPGPPSDGGTYWVVPAFADQPEAGPQKAKGVILWSHGLSGQNPQWQSPPPDVIRDLGRAGWDVVKINRHGLHERSWTDTGRKHVAHLIALAQTKRDAGYRRIVAAGQSYGGAISIEAAAAAPDLFHGVFAAAPGHGSDACFGGPSVNSAQQMMPRLVGAIDLHRAGRTVILMAPGDNCQGPNRPTGPIRAALQATGRPFVFLDDRIPVGGHSALYTEQFRVWYRACLQRFLEAEAVPTGENACPAPSPAPDFLTPGNVTLGMADADGSGLRGWWRGSFHEVTVTTISVPNQMFVADATGQAFCLAVAASPAESLSLVAYWGAGSKRNLSMTSARYTFGRDGARYVHAGADQYRFTLTPEAGGKRLAIVIRSLSGNNTFYSSVERRTDRC